MLPLVNQTATCAGDKNTINKKRIWRWGKRQTSRVVGRGVLTPSSPVSDPAACLLRYIWRPQFFEQWDKVQGLFPPVNMTTFRFSRLLSFVVWLCFHAHNRFELFYLNQEVIFLWTVYFHSFVSFPPRCISPRLPRCFLVFTAHPCTLISLACILWSCI